jgi:hypothetical protein
MIYIRYDEVITADHVMASGSFPVNFDYATLEVESHKAGHNQNRTIDILTANLVGKDIFGMVA